MLQQKQKAQGCGAKTEFIKFDKSLVIAELDKRCTRARYTTLSVDST